MLPTTVSEYRRGQQRLLVATLSLVRREWSRMGDDLDGSWSRVGPRIALLTTAAQARSARDGAGYVADVLDAQGTPVEPVATIRPAALAGLAPDGRSLEQMLYSAVVRARSAKVESLPQRLDVGRAWLDQLVHTAVSDAGRDAAKIAVTVRPRVRWVRVVSPPCCQRCAVLAGESRTFSHQFKRHPRCDCAMLPQTVANPDAVWHRIDPSQITDLTGKQRLAIASSTEKDPAKALRKVVNDYQRKSGQFSGYLPPTRVDKVVERAGQREKALDALRAIGVVV